MIIKPSLRLQSLGDLRLHGTDGDVLRRRRKELALLVVVAARAPRHIRREEAQALFWPERDEQRARHSLRQALLRVRRACGEDALEIAVDTLRVPNGGLTLDAREFTDAAAGGRFRNAVELWTGDFMVGCEDVGGEELRSWIDAERARLQRVLYSCFEGLIVERTSVADWAEVARWSGRWTERFPLDEPAAMHCIEALCRSGRSADAAAERAAFVRRLAVDIEEDPAPEWLERTTSLIEAARAAPAISVADLPRGPAPTPESSERVAPTPPAARRPPRWLVAAAAIAVAVAILTGVAWRGDLFDPRASRPTVLAVGRIESVGLPDSAAALPSLLSITLSEVRGLSMLSEGRIQQLRAQLGARGDAAADLQRAAKAAGANQLIEGVLARRPGGRLRLDLRRVGLENGESRATYTVEGTDMYAIVAAAAERIAADLDLRFTATHAVGTTSLSAARFYEEGLRAWYAGEEQAAARLFGAALDEDSTFAMAAFYLSPLSGNRSAELLRQARRMSQRGPDRDRLFIEAHWLGARDEPAQLAVAETLVIRYPAEPGAHFEYARALVRAGRFLEAVPYYRRVIQMDSLGLRGEHARCLACDGYVGVLGAYRYADSLPALQRVAREWVVMQPRSPTAWMTLSAALSAGGRFPEALENASTAYRFDRTNTLASRGLMDLWLRQGAFASADRYWGGLLSTPGTQRADAFSAAASSLRIQGRLAEALDAAVQGRVLTMRPDKPLGDAHEHANALCDIGRYRACIALFDSVSLPDPNDSDARQARNRAWFLTHAATAAAALRDTALLRRLEDTIRVRGARSGFRRDQLLHHYVRGLRLRLRGDTASAAEAFRLSLYSPVEGNTRASLELARALMTLNRHLDAVRVLHSAHWGPIGASGQYVNRTELELMLARAHDRLNQQDSAAAHYAWVLNAWKAPDPRFREERRALEERVRRLATARPMR